jgi:hypothetical protein
MSDCNGFTEGIAIDDLEGDSYYSTLSAPAENA